MLAAESLVYPCSEAKVAVVELNGEYKVVATEHVAAGDEILKIEGRETKVPSKYSVQIGVDFHIDIDSPECVEQNPERYLWRFLNHKCRPNAYLKAGFLFATESIEVGQEITFNYNANEYEMSCPFECWCDGHNGSASVEIRGYKFLDARGRAQLEPFLAEHLRGLA